MNENEKIYNINLRLIITIFGPYKMFNIYTKIYKIYNIIFINCF